MAAQEVHHMSDRRNRKTRRNWGTGSLYHTARGWGVRWLENDKRRYQSGFATKTEASDWFLENVKPRLVRGESVPEKPKVATLSEFVVIYLERHAAVVRQRTVTTLRERLRHAERGFGSVPLRDLERMVDEIAAWRAKQPQGVRYGRTQALKQALTAAVTWGYMSTNPVKVIGKNPQPPARPVRVYTREELDAIADELSSEYQPLPAFVAATGLRPEEWQALRHADIDRRAGVLSVKQTVSGGEIVELGKTSRSRRQVPLSPRALAALDALPTPMQRSTLIFSSPEGCLLHLDNFRHREWSPAIKAAGIAKPARIYDTRHTFASNAIAAGIQLFELAKIMGTSVEMIERVYGSLLGGASASIASRLAAFETHTDLSGAKMVSADE
jgi:integrase